MLEHCKTCKLIRLQIRTEHKYVPSLAIRYSSSAAP